MVDRDRQSGDLLLAPRRGAALGPNGAWHHRRGPELLVRLTLKVKYDWR